MSVSEAFKYSVGQQLVVNAQLEMTVNRQIVGWSVCIPAGTLCTVVEPVMYLSAGSNDDTEYPGYYVVFDHRTGIIPQENDPGYLISEEHLSLPEE